MQKFINPKTNTVRGVVCMKKITTFFVALVLSIPVLAQTYVSTESELRAIATAVNNGTTTYDGETIYLKNDITLVSNWTPIGTEASPFKGFFEGWGHVISGLNITGSSDYQGLFGYISGGRVRDVAVQGSVSGGNYVGGICGKMDDYGSIVGCRNDATVTGTQYVGGICGEFTATGIENCYNTGAISATDYVGGIAGNIAETSSMSYCYTTGSITASKLPYGALVGAATIGTLNYCYYDLKTATISAYPFSARAFYYESDYSVVDDIDNDVVGVSTENMKLKSFWEGRLLNDDKAWYIVNGEYPRLDAFVKGHEFTLSFGSGNNWSTIVPNGNYSVPSGLKAYMVSNATTENVTLRRVTTLNEGRAALLYWETGTEQNFTVTSTNGALADYTDDKWLKGSHVSPIAIGGEDKKHFVLFDGQFHRATSGTLARGKAYLDLTGVAGEARSSLSIQFEDESAGITEVSSEALPSQGYDLNGRRVRPTQRGIVIINGKKIYKQ